MSRHSRRLPLPCCFFFVSHASRTRPHYTTLTLECMLQQQSVATCFLLLVLLPLPGERSHQAGPQRDDARRAFCLNTITAADANTIATATSTTATSTTATTTTAATSTSGTSTATAATVTKFTCGFSICAGDVAKLLHCCRHG